MVRLPSGFKLSECPNIVGEDKSKNEEPDTPIVPPEAVGLVINSDP